MNNYSLLNTEYNNNISGLIIIANDQWLHSAKVVYFAKYFGGHFGITINKWKKREIAS